MSTNSQKDATRPGELEVPLPERVDAGVVFIGRIHTPYPTRAECPRQGRSTGPVCRIEVDPQWREGLKGLGQYSRVEVIYWLHLARRDIILQSPKSNGQTTGAFALRSPVRPNPIATSLCDLVGVEDGAILVRGLDCVDGTPLLDLKPYRCDYSPLAPAKDSASEPLL